MPAFEHHFLPLDPPPTSTEERDVLQSLGQINYDTRSGAQLVVRFLGTKTGVSVIAVTMPESAISHPDREKWFKQILETSIAAIRLSYDPNCQPVYTGNGFLNLMYQSDEPEPKFPATVRFSINPDFVVNINNVIGTFGAIHKKYLSDIAILLADAQVNSMPPQYAVLSLVRAIELLWTDEHERAEILALYETNFAKLKLSERPLRNALPEIRNRCAHGRGRGRGGPEPYVGLGVNNEALRSLKALLGSIVAHGLREIYGIEIALKDNL